MKPLQKLVPKSMNEPTPVEKLGSSKVILNLLGFARNPGFLSSGFPLGSIWTCFSIRPPFSKPRGSHCTWQAAKTSAEKPAGPAVDRRSNPCWNVLFEPEAWLQAAKKKDLQEGSTGQSLGAPFFFSPNSAPRAPSLRAWRVGLVFTGISFSWRQRLVFFFKVRQPLNWLGFGFEAPSFKSGKPLSWWFGVFGGFGFGFETPGSCRV